MSGISLLEIEGKVLARICLDRLQAHFECSGQWHQLCSIMLFLAMLTDTFSGEYVNRELRSRTYGGYYKPQRLKADSKVTLTSS